MEIRRDIVERLKEWKNQESKKPILLKGARQIGKTWVMETFGRECFDYCAKFDIYSLIPLLLRSCVRT